MVTVARRDEMAGLKNASSFFAKEKDMVATFTQLKEKLDGVRNKMEKSYATKNEVREESTKISQAVGNHYVSMSNFADFRKRSDDKTSDQTKMLEAARTSLANHTSHITSLKKFIEDCCKKDDLRNLTVQLKRFALYEDYKELYNKTVMPVTNMEAINNIMV